MGVASLHRRTKRWIVSGFRRLRLRLRSALSTLGEWLAYFVVRVIICVIQSLPPATCVRLSRALGFLCGNIFQIRRNVVEDNLVHAFPDASYEERRQIELRMWHHLFMMICEIALARRKIHETNWRRHVTFHNQPALVGAMLSPRPLVIVTAHLGNFEMSGYISGLLGFPTFTIARTLDNRFLHKFLMNFRNATGQYVLPTHGSGEQAQAVMKSGESLALLGDHFGGKKGCWVNFFDRPASCHKAISVFSLANKAPIAVVYTPRTGEFLKFCVVTAEVYDPAVDDSMTTIPAMTKWYNEHIETAVRQSPDQYWWLHKRWKDPREKKKKLTRISIRRDAAENLPSGSDRVNYRRESA